MPLRFDNARLVHAPSNHQRLLGGLRVSSWVSLTGDGVKLDCGNILTCSELLKPLLSSPFFVVLSSGFVRISKDLYTNVFKKTCDFLKRSQSSHRGAVEMNPTRNHEVVGSIPGLTQWIKDPAVSCRGRLQTRLRSGIAVAVVEVGSCSSDLTSSLGTSICCRCGPKKRKRTKRKKKYTGQ